MLRKDQLYQPLPASYFSESSTNSNSKTSSIDAVHALVHEITKQAHNRVPLASIVSKLGSRTLQLVGEISPPPASKTTSKSKSKSKQFSKTKQKSKLLALPQAPEPPPPPTPTPNTSNSNSNSKKRKRSRPKNPLTHNNPLIFSGTVTLSDIQSLHSLWLSYATPSLVPSDPTKFTNVSLIGAIAVASPHTPPKKTVTPPPFIVLQETENLWVVVDSTKGGKARRIYKNQNDLRIVHTIENKVYSFTVTKLSSKVN